MGYTSRILVKNACYHLLSRGNRKQRVFETEDDYVFYLALLKKFRRKFGFHVYAYCLMPNHAHIFGLFEEPAQQSNFMHDLMRTYTLYFNNKYGKVGHLWQGRFKSYVVLRDQYLIDCITYIEQNPLRASLVEYLSQYRWSSYSARVLGKNDGIIEPVTFTLGAGTIGNPLQVPD